MWPVDLQRLRYDAVFIGHNFSLDGGAMDDYGSFGWVVSTKEGDRLATGSGSVFGSDPRSYRAEGHGAKAGTLFIIHCFRYCNVPIPPGQFTVYCDNQGLL
jgi:hypothetical protein